MYKIEKLNETQAKPRLKNRETYPFSKMKSGDSFFVPDTDKCAKSVKVAAYAYGRRHGVALRTCKAEKQGVKGVMVFIDYDAPTPSDTEDGYFS